MIFYFNGDLEHFLNSRQKKYSISFNKFNQEFEFLISIIENVTICTDREYSSLYADHLKSTFDVNLKTSINKREAKLWCCDFYDLDFQKKINSRFYTQNIANEFNREKVVLINDFSDVEEGFVYKEDLSVSGIGNYLFPKNKEKIRKVLKESKLLKDKFYKRDLDLSSFVENDEIVHYENIVDEYFQYKGTIIGRNFSNQSWFKDYESKVKRFVSLKLPIRGVYSIDSFISDNEVIFMSEINNRKTMGYIAYKIKEKYFSDYLLLKTILIPNKKIQNKSYVINIQNVQLISPISNMFGFYIIAANSEKELREKEHRLYSLIFE